MVAVLLLSHACFVNSTWSSFFPGRNIQSRLCALPSLQGIWSKVKSSFHLYRSGPSLPLIPWSIQKTALPTPLPLVLRDRDTETLMPSLQSLVQSEVLACVDGISQWSLELALDPSGGASISAAWSLEMLLN